MTNLHYRHRHLDVACELDAAEAGARATEWRRLRDEAGLGAEPIPGGARIWLRPEAWEAAADLARRETACCGFLDLDLTAEADRLRLDVTSLAPEAPAVIACLAGTGAECALKCC